MNNKKAKEVIKEYKPHKGFFDLSDQPKKLSNIEYAKILEAQDLLAYMEKDKEYLIKYNPTQWFKLQEISAQLQRTILYYWENSIFD